MLIDHSVIGDIGATRANDREAVDCQHYEHDRHNRDGADGPGTPKCWVIELHEAILP
jgi:hypothetical protein